MSVRSLIVAIGVVLAGLVLASPAEAYPTMPQGIQGPYTVIKVVDGDTIWVDNHGKRQKIRMIGLDTPESVDPRKPVQCFGKEASAQAKTILGGQQHISPYRTGLPSSSQLAATFLLGCTRGGSPGIFGVPPCSWPC